MAVSIFFGQGSTTLAKKNWDSHPCQTTGACMLERSRACARSCAAVFGQVVVLPRSLLPACKSPTLTLLKWQNHNLFVLCLTRLRRQKKNQPKPTPIHDRLVAAQHRPSGGTPQVTACAIFFFLLCNRAAGCGPIQMYGAGPALLSHSHC